MSENNALIGYQQACQAAAYFRPAALGSMIVAGKDRESFLQRQTSNDIRQLEPDRALLTVLTSPTARILDLLYLLAEQDQIRGLTLANTGGKTASFLKSRIFFKDQVTVQDTSAEVVQINLVGPEWPQVLERAFGISFSELDRVVSFETEGHLVRVWAGQPAIMPGAIFLAPAGAVEAVIQQIESAGASRLSTDAWDVIRVEFGLPGFQAELSEDFTPLEVGLSQAISDSKGCYTGQEIIARQITYDKITQQLRVLRMETLLEPGAQIRVEGKKAGVLTSAVQSPRFGPLGLAVVKRPYNEPGTMLELETGEEGSLISARVVELPLS